jgi:threonine dehydrogenase-like Zn-dependent dehydrogenase
LAAEVAVFTEPLAAALRIAEQVHIDAADGVAVVGDGRLALMCVQAVALGGAPVTVLGRNPAKRALFAPFCAEFHTEVRTVPAGGFEVVIDATGNPQSLATSIALTRSGGTLVMKSTYADVAQIDMSDVVVRELRIQGSRCGPFAPALRLLARGQVTLPAVQVYDPADWRAAIDSPAFKAALDFRQMADAIVS